MLAGSVYVRKIPPLYSFQGSLPYGLTADLEKKGCFYREGKWWVRESGWPDLERLFLAMGIAIEADSGQPLTRRATFDLTSLGQIIVRGDLPRRLPPEWLGQTKALAYVGLTPYALADAVKAFKSEGIEPVLVPAVQQMMTRVTARLATCAALQSSGPAEATSGQLANGEALWPYQRAAPPFWEATRGRMLLADEPGLGKTPQAIAIARAGSVARILVLSPAVAKWNWEGMVRKFDGRKSLVLDGRTPGRIPKDAAWVLANFDIASSWLSVLEDWDPDLVICDEAHHLKNPEAHRSIAAKRLSKGAKQALFLTGTPITNRPMDLHNLLDALEPRMWGTKHTFGLAFADGRENKFGWDYRGSSREDVLHRYLKGIMLRRRKEDVLKDLPPKTRVSWPVELDEAHRIRYFRMFGAFKEWAREGGPKDKGEVLARLLSLRQLSSEGRVGATVEMAVERVEEGKPVVVFAYFLDSLRAIETLLKAKGLRVATIHGSVDPKRRKEIQTEFQAGNLDVLVGQTHAAGEAIDLFRADTTIFHDLDWSPYKLIQAEDRVHRAGQTSKTTHVYLTGRGTVDEDILSLLLKKLAAASAVLDTGVSVEDEVVEMVKRNFWTGPQRRLG